MVDRQDIDALLISALYGELTPADEARLQTHLDSHPADRTALADLTVARNAVRESRILTVQLEPPQAVSALLLQEAARRAPKPAKVEEREGWFQRFVRSFASHPAMAAAAMLVLVVGVAGTMYLRGDRAVEQTADRDNASSEVSAPATASTPDTTLALESRRLEQNAGSAYQASLDEGRRKDSEATPATGADDQGDEEATEAPGGEVAKKKPVKRGGDTYLSTPRVQPQPKELDSDKAAAPAKRSSVKNDAIVEDTRKGGAAGGFVPRPETVTATPPAADRQPSRNAPAAPPPPVTAPVVGSANEEQKQEKQDEDASWAREVHGRVQAAVRANDCKSATSLAMALSNRAPGYYAQNVDNDRELKTCRTYINAERDREAERVQRARAQQRRNSDEKAAKPTAEPKAAGH
jgi:hypothetical protein